MSKRRAIESVSDSEDEFDDIAAPPPKRTHTTEPGTDPISQGQCSNEATERTDEDVEINNESGDEGPADQEANPDELDHQYKDLIRAFRQARQSIQGSVAEYGIIESVEMHQFMCHEHLSFDFHERINFIIGHNGSGKSAVLSAIIIALGGKTNSTGRGTGLKSFIREGQSVAEVSLTLKNQGEEAYRHDIYGDSIVITRRFTKDGSSTWKIQSKDKRTISTKKEELSAICDHMNIEVDNPLNVLTQDASRKFLSASHPGEKYDCFLRGTQLSQLSDEYDVCLENIRLAEKIIAQKKEDVSSLEDDVETLTIRLTEAAKVRDQQEKLDALKMEYAWALVKKKELELEEKMMKAVEESRTRRKIEGHVAEAETQVQATSEEVIRLEAEYRDLGDNKHLTDRKREVQDEIRANRAKLREFMNDERRMNDSLKDAKRQIEEFETQIAEETRRLEADNQAKRDEMEQRLQSARGAVSAANAHLESLRSQRKELQDSADQAVATGETIQDQITAARASIQEQKNKLQQLENQQRDRLAAFGRDMVQLKARVKQMKWYGDEPLGPLGERVSVGKDYEWTSEVLGTQLGRTLTSWAVTSASDIPQLKSLLKESGNQQTGIIVFEKDMFDYSRGEPSNDTLTVLRALEIPDAHVLRILINQHSIERTYLAHNHTDASEILNSCGGGVAWTKSHQLVMVFAGGGGQSSQLRKVRSDHPFTMLLTRQDVVIDTRPIEEELRRQEADCTQLCQEEATLKAKYTSIRRDIEEITTQETRADVQLRSTKMNLENLIQSFNDDLPANTAGLEAAKREAESERESIKAQFASLTESKAKVDAAQTTLLTEADELRVQIEEFQLKSEEMQNKITDAATRCLDAKNAKSHYESKLTDQLRQVDQAEAQVQLVQEEFTNWTAKAYEYCERVENPRTPDELERLIAGATIALDAQQKKDGASMEELANATAKAQSRLSLVNQDLEAMDTLLRTLEKSLKARFERWHEFRSHIASRCKHIFQYNLSHRGYFGQVFFSHTKRTLQIRVQPDEAVGSGGSQAKDIRSLSGGEKSISTMCLLLSLWECIGCPLRCLDEFDVFMDAVNRGEIMKMILEIAKSSNKKQYIFITPLDLPNTVPIGSHVRVNKMPDPDRGQGQLASSS